jgi:hypothetical protein
MKNLLNNISQEEKNRILEMHSFKKKVITEEFEDKFALAMVFLGGLAPFMRYFGGKLGDFIIHSSLTHHDKKAFKKLFTEIESNPDDFKLTYEKSEGQINMLIESNGDIELDHYNNIELPISFSINDNGGVEVTYVSTDGEQKEISFNMGEKAYHRVEQLIEKFGEEMSDDEK